MNGEGEGKITGRVSPKINQSLKPRNAHTNQNLVKPRVYIIIE